MIIGLSGELRSGKDTVAEMLRQRWGFEVISFAHALKEEVIARLWRTLVAIHELEGHAHENTSCSWANREACIKDMVWNRKPPATRALLQEYGTEIRRQDNPAYWEERWMERVAGRPLVVAADVRFENEARAVLAQGGELWLVERPGLERVESPHVSEEFCKTWTRWDAVIGNGGTIEGLSTQVDALAKTALERVVLG